MSANLKLAQLNIEGSKHLDRIIPFLKEQKPDVVCLQELNEPDIQAFEEALGTRCSFAPMNFNKSESLHGVGIFTARRALNVRTLQYGGRKEKGFLVSDHSDKQSLHDSKKFLLLFIDIEKDGEIFHIGTTHFPVTAHGEATDYQREDMARLLALLKQEGEFVLTGDFNAPRGGEIFAMLAAKYTDNIPPGVTTSIDGNLHRTGQLPHMVDGIFSTPGYAVSNVVGHTGLSDHWGFTAEVSKN